jgi:hypothetical protein
MAGSYPNLPTLGGTAREVAQAVNYLLNAVGPLLAKPALSLDFVNGVYSAGNTTYGTLSSLPGYSYSRTGQQGAIDINGSAAWFADNIPAINGYGLNHYPSATNAITYSQQLENAAWTAGGLTVTTGAGTAPDGTTTMERLQSTGTNSIYQLPSVGTGIVCVCAKYTDTNARYLEVYVSGYFTAACFDLLNGVVVGASSGVTAFILPANNGGYYCCAAGNVTGGTGAGLSTSSTIGNQGDAPSGAGALLWQFQATNGSLPSATPPPLIATTSASATIDAPTLTVNCPNGSYTATYTFDDDSTQTESVTVSAGTFTLDIYPTLNRPRIKKVVVQ